MGRKTTGPYYTPPSLVNELDKVRVGAGAFGAPEASCARLRKVIWLMLSPEEAQRARKLCSPSRWADPARGSGAF